MTTDWNETVKAILDTLIINDIEQDDDEVKESRRQYNQNLNIQYMKRMWKSQNMRKEKQKMIFLVIKLHNTMVLNLKQLKIISNY